MATMLCINRSTSQLSEGSTSEMECEIPQHLCPVSPYEDLGRDFANLIREHIERRNMLRTGEDNINKNSQDTHLDKETQELPKELMSKEQIPPHTSETQGETSNTSKSKKKKWKPASHLLNIKYDDSELNRKIVSCDEHSCDTKQIAETMALYDEELELYENKYGQFEHYEILGARGNKGYIRKDRDRKVQRARKQIKQKQCREIQNEGHNKSKQFMHHRIYKLVCLRRARSDDKFQPILKYKDSKAAVSCNDKIKTKIEKTSNTKTPHAHTPAKNYQKAQVHILHNTASAPNEFSNFDTNIVSAFINLQHREITPEDFDLLLNLDDLCAPKTVNKEALHSLRVEAVHEHDILEDPCAVCMEVYLVGQNKKYLLCGHIFHETCIDQWLAYSSTNCPLDGIPVN